MVTASVIVKNPMGLHLYPSEALCSEALKYRSSVKFTKDGVTANAKSLLSILGARVKCGSEITFFCEGMDEEEALEAVVRLVESGLGEQREETQALAEQQRR